MTSVQDGRTILLQILISLIQFMLTIVYCVTPVCKLIADYFTIFFVSYES